MKARWLVPPAPPNLTTLAAAPTFSVVIPAYQAENFVGAAVESVLGQTLPAREVIVCDDGSTDRTAEVLAAFGDRITVVRQTNRGLPAAKNAAARRATADFIAVLDADDQYMPRRLEEMGRLAAARPDLDLLNTDWLIRRNGTTLRRRYEEVRFPTTDQRLAILRHDFLMSGLAIRRSRFWEVGGFDEAIDFADDWDMWLRLILDGSSVGLVDEPLGVYRVHDEAMSTDRRRDMAGRLTVLERARAAQQLSKHERELLEEVIYTTRHRLRLISAEQVLIAGGPTARRQMLALSVARGVQVATRIKALLAAAAPQLAGRFVFKRLERGRSSRLERPLPKE